MAGVVTGVLSAVYVLICLFLILIVLLQKGEGGGLAGAFGGMGGESAFGVKGDKTFKKATGMLGALFLVLAIVLGAMIERGYQGATTTTPGNETDQVVPDDTPPGETGGGTPDEPR